ncbi:hypothetical protein CBM2634_A230141 [Cupriavidus taiwanensis]|uniref:Uncharacterized protein n=1 Tax=Cupriavidus taiwanensis TaxID=164546 RepID=A0A375J0E3_9BURK|nr:hypothetical protein CBM2634_A230141 [Cupriavidus taiwanensis]
MASTSFCATEVPVFGSAASSSPTSSSLIFLPPTSRPDLLTSSTARRAPFSLSLPRCAIPPVSGAAWPILTTVSPPPAAGAAGAAAAGAEEAGSAGFSSFLPQAATSATAAAIGRILANVICMSDLLGFTKTGICNASRTFPWTAVV